MIGKLGLLTREGIDHFYPIFKDMENWMNKDYDDPFPTTPFDNKPRGPGAAKTYRERLEKVSSTLQPELISWLMPGNVASIHTREAGQRSRRPH